MLLMQVDGGHFSSDDQAKGACKQLATKLGQDQAPAKSSFRVLAGSLNNNATFAIVQLQRHVQSANCYQFVRICNTSHNFGNRLRWCMIQCTRGIVSFAIACDAQADALGAAIMHHAWASNAIEK